MFRLLHPAVRGRETVGEGTCGNVGWQPLVPVKKILISFFKQQDGIGEEVLKMSTEEIIQRTRLLDSEIKVGIWLQCRQWNPNQTRPADPSRFYFLIPQDAGGLGSVSWDQRKKKGN